ncbi:MAG: hypothetical protein COB02_00325 [Candidatus Cloacimonadota bacterium]|nr:MAG: hypothetical protein COB02_00325 [Candidatus Cloacimonadota bacterium]
MTNTQKSENNSQGLIDNLKKRFIEDFENLIQHCWIYGYAIDTLKVAYYLILLDNYFKYDIQENYPNIDSQLKSVFTVQQFADILSQNPDLCDEAIDYIGGLLQSINKDAHKFESLSKIQIQLDTLTNQFLFGHFLEKETSQEDPPLHIKLKHRTLNQYHLYRWLTGKRYQSSGTNLAIVSQWIPDLEAIASLNNLINTKKIKLKEGYYPLNSLIPIGGKQAVKLNSLEDFFQVLINPAKKLRLPATSNSSVVSCIETILNIDFVELAKSQSNLKDYQNLLDTIQSEKFKDHLFLDPFSIDHPLLPAPTDCPVDISDLGTFRNSVNVAVESSKTHKPSLTDQLIENTFEVVQLVGKLKPYEIQRVFQNIKHSSEQTYKKLLGHFKTVLTPSKKKTQQSKEQTEPKSKNTKTKDKPSPLKLKLDYNSPLNKFDTSLPNTPSKPIPSQLIVSTLQSELWKTNPQEFSELIYKILHLSNDSALGLDNIFQLTQSSKESQDDNEILTLIQLAADYSKSLNKGQMEILNQYIHNLPEIGNLINNNHCEAEASKLIKSEKWDLLPKKDKIKLRKLANEKHLIEVAEIHMDDFLRKESLSDKDIENLGEITSILLEALVNFLEKSSENSDSFEDLLNKVKVLHKQHTDKMRSKITDIDDFFVTEIQNWLQELLQFIYERDEKEYLECIAHIEAMFISVWKKVEQQLKNQVINKN